MPDYIYVLGKDGSPQMPTTRRRHVLRLLNTGKARITQHVPFTIQLLYDNIPVLQPITFAEDPGRTNIGMAALSLEGKLLFSAICETRNKEIAKLMEDRKNHRRASRYGETVWHRLKGRDDDAETTCIILVAIRDLFSATWFVVNLIVIG